MRRKQSLIFVSIISGLLFALILGFLPLLIPSPTSSHLAMTVPTPTPTFPPSPTPTPRPVPPLELSRVMTAVYQSDRSAFSHLPQNEIIQIVAAGDVMLGRAVGINITRLQNFNYPFELVAGAFRTADIAMVNLENPIITDCPLTAEGMIFCSSPGTIGGLEFAGIDAVNLANNHTLNHGYNGLQETTEYLTQNYIRYSGLVGSPAVIDVRGTRVAILGFTAFGGSGVLSELNRTSIQAELSQARDISDIQIVNFHWGAEYQSQPTPGQRLLAYAAIDAGADAVIGHHAHWVQGMEIYQNKPIFYSLGNLVFDQMWSQETREGLIVELNFFRGEVAGIYMYPTFMENIAQPNLIPAGPGNLILAKVETLSQSLQSSQAQTLELYQPPATSQD